MFQIAWFLIDSCYEAKGSVQRGRVSSEGTVKPRHIMDKENAITLPPLICCDPNPQVPCLSQASISQLGLGWEIQELEVLPT